MSGGGRDDGDYLLTLDGDPAPLQHLSKALENYQTGVAATKWAERAADKIAKCDQALAR